MFYNSRSGWTINSYTILPVRFQKPDLIVLVNNEIQERRLNCFFDHKALVKVFVRKWQVTLSTNT